VEITFDQAKRDWTLAERGLAFEDAAKVFTGPTYQWIDDRQNYGETRVITVGWLQDRMVIVVWTEREQARHVMSMRKANDREQARYRERLE
jgi:uncharacterized protein